MRLAQTKHTLGRYVHRLSGLPARHELDDTLRRTLLANGQIEPDVDTLREMLDCPADAGS